MPNTPFPTDQKFVNIFDNTLRCGQVPISKVGLNGDNCPKPSRWTMARQPKAPADPTQPNQTAEDWIEYIAFFLNQHFCSLNSELIKANEVYAANGHENLHRFEAVLTQLRDFLNAGSPPGKSPSRKRKSSQNPNMVQLTSQMLFPLVQDVASGGNGSFNFTFTAGIRKNRKYDPQFGGYFRVFLDEEDGGPIYGSWHFILDFELSVWLLHPTPKRGRGALRAIINGGSPSSSYSTSSSSS